MHNINRKRGKNTQRKIAQIVKGNNTGTLGGEDIAHPDLSIEVKHRKMFVGSTFMSQAMRNCPKGKIPIVIVHVHGKRHLHDLVLIHLSDFTINGVPLANQADEQNVS